MRLGRRLSRCEQLYGLGWQERQTGGVPGLAVRNTVAPRNGIRGVDQLLVVEQP